ncbi:hypothetical protein A2U01_0062135, partial [Trifolium medium]|nr:hypothetical protein [Trifolium medium]
MYFPVLHSLPIVLDNGVHSESCRRDHGGYPPRLGPDPIKLGVRDCVHQPMALRRLCHLNLKSRGDKVNSTVNQIHPS